MFSFLRKTALWIVALPLLCLGIGIGLNQAVLNANQDRFPVLISSYEVAQYALELEKGTQSKDADVVEEATFKLEALDAGYLDDTHVIMTSKTHLNFLADWIDAGSVYSPGDLLIYAGEYSLTYVPFVWVTVVIVRLNRREDKY